MRQLAFFATILCMGYVSAQDAPYDINSTISQFASDEHQSTIQQVSYQCGGNSCCGDTCCGEGCNNCCGLPFWAHKHKIFGDWLYLRARQQHVDFATPVDGTTATAVPLGRTHVLDPDYASGLRVGGAIAIDRCSSIEVAWTNYSSTATNAVQLPGGATAPNAFLRSELVHPNTTDVGTDSLFASGIYGIDFQTVDIAFEKTLSGDCNYRLNGSVGFRFGDLEQDLRAQHRILTDVMVDTDIDFDGYGPRFALDYERQNCKGLLTYFRGGVSLLMGRFDADYRQTSVFAGRQATAGIFEDRIVPQYELEIGGGWESQNGAFRITAGYLITAWTNVLTTPAFIDAVQANELDDVDDTLTFDGLALRAEVLF